MAMDPRSTKIAEQQNFLQKSANEIGHFGFVENQIN
jgi:hypothetical protein